MSPLAARSFEVEVSEPQYCRILGINFYTGNVAQAVDRMMQGGLLVVPAAPALKDLPSNAGYREALLGADVVIPDSMFMVMVWRILTGQRVERVSGLEYLREFFRRAEAREPGRLFWVMANETSAARNLNWLRTQGIDVDEKDYYCAPFYRKEVSDPELVQRIQSGKYAHVFITIGGGKQEQLGLYLKRSVTPVRSIHCIGAAIAFLSGDQVPIPVWTDKIGLGWLFRCLSSPKTYVPRYWAARKLLGLMIRYRDRLPPTEGSV